MSLPLFDNVSHSRPKSHTAERPGAPSGTGSTGNSSRSAFERSTPSQALSESTIRDAIAELMILHNVPIGAPRYRSAELLHGRDDRGYRDRLQTVPSPDSHPVATPPARWKAGVRFASGWPASREEFDS